MQGVQIVKV